MEVLKKSAGYVLPGMGNRLTYLSLLLAGIFSALLFALAPTPASTLTTVPTKMNFQGRLADSAGNIKANGTYNMRLKLYAVASGGSSVWSEDRLVSATQGVTVTNGTFSIQLGSITTLPATLFASGALYLEVELPTPATATSASPTWTEGPMTPRNQMATSAYAYNAETLDGFDSADFGQAATSNTWSGANLFKNTTNSTTAFSVQDSTSNVLLNADTTNKRVTVGGGPGTSTARVHIEGQASTAAMTWTPRTAAFATGWKSITYGKGIFVAVGGDGITTSSIQTSPDGINWTVRTAPVTNSWNSVTYGNGMFVAVGEDGANRVMSSRDGITWTSYTVGLHEWSSVTYGNGLFVAVQQSGGADAITSPDGINWTVRSTGAVESLTSVTYGNGLFVAIGMVSGSDQVTTSPDGITWTARTASEASTWFSITYGNGLFVAVSFDGTNRVTTSPDGITWTARSAAQANNWQSVTYGNGLFVAVSSDGTNRVMTSPDGITWTARSASEANGWTEVTYGNGLFVAVAGDGTNRVMTSSDIALTARGSVQITGDISSTGGLSVAGDLTTNGAVLFKNTANSTTAFSIQDSASNVLINADTANKRVTLGGGPGTSTARVHIEGQASTSAMTWTARTAAAANSWTSITYGNGLFVAVSQNGTNRVMTSPDGITWTARTASEANGWASVTYGNGLFVAVAASGTNRVMTSPDGITWTARTASEANSWTSVTYGNGQFVAVATSGTNRVMTSPDGITWTARAAAEANTWFSVTYGNGLYVAVSNDGTNRVMTSPNGISWTARAAAEANTWYTITYSNGLFVAVAQSGTNLVMTSPDGITWTARAAAEANAWVSVTYGNGQFVAISSTGTNRVMTSGDIALTTRGSVQINGDLSATGTVTAKANSLNAFTIQNIDSSQTLFNANTISQRVSIGTATGSSARVHIEGQASTAAMQWTARAAAQANLWVSVTYGNGLFVAISNDGTNRVQTSPDGITWTARTAAEANTWYSVTYGNGLFVAVAGTGTNRVMTSPDGITWTARAAAQANNWYSVTYGGGQFVAVAGSGTNRVMTSPDGITWTVRTAAEANEWNSVTYGGGLFVAVSVTGTNRVMTSPDGITWTARAAAEANFWMLITYGNGLFVAVSYDGTNRVMTSPDGITWTARAAEANQWYSVTYGNGLFVAVADSGTNRVMTSPDGITWTARAAAQANSWNSVTYGNGLFVAVAASGNNRVMTSGDIALTTRGAVQVTGDVRSTGDITSSGSVNATGLTITNQSSQGYVATLSNTSSATSADGLLIKLGVANASRTTGNYFVGFADSTGTVAGKIQGGASAVAYTTTAADYAEYFKADPASMPQPGELVTLDLATPNGVKLASEGQMTMGVVSTSPGFVGNGPLCHVDDEDCDANYAKSNALVSLVGQVPLKVTGEVKIGDMLGASNTPGVAQKVTSGSYVGYALSASQNGVVQVLIRPGTLDSLSSVQGGDATFTSLVTSGVATVGDLVVTGDAEFKGNLTVLGILETSDIIINGHLMTGGPAPSATVGTVLSHSSSELSIEGTDGAGTLVIKSGGGTTIGVVSHIKFAKQYAGSSKVVLSPVNGNAADIRVYVVKTADGFDIVTKDVLVQGETYEFDYIVVGVNSLE